MDRVFADVGSQDLTLTEVLRLVEKIRDENPDMEVFLDGDKRAIMGRPRVVQVALER
ncbi:hypothetical protein SDC9_145309 [bioreactor metagenome]|jgi:hypothetical protein|uniref:Uncharacterized protein n=1 Tax=bioreactor metagenome TaxID=1076179 RepID=A0A645E946_9ZZZZ|nr:hypothetical protein [Candidatus Methanomethylophilaceae archaeon]MDI9378891.1 hypothetical protein [Candidatus Thermoplasmatota archaeon]MDD2779711.1 hypothetical protein [Candidatus Methanomethylophilaceae archaeon]MDD3127759.1 hypothetical protein [Candidatus Methanomethylophilaceae archaeon]MDD4119488.1 hypothetical protein [Candidatus Methanomethylophilaceae archaeon]